MVRVFFLFACLQLGSTLSALSQTVNVQFKPIENSEIGDASINSIYQDSKGFVWFVSSDGLIRYDGQQSHFFKSNPHDSTSLSSNRLHQIIEADAGHFYIATGNGGINYFDSHKRSFTPFKHNPNDSLSIANNNVYCLLFTYDKTLWAGTDEGISVLDSANETFIHYSHSNSSLSGNYVNCIYQASDGTIWVGTDMSGLNRFDTQTNDFRNYRKQTGEIPNNTIWEIKEDPEESDSIIWLATYGGLVRFNYVTEKSQLFTKAPDTESVSSVNQLRCLEFDPNGNIWVGSRNSGLSVLRATDKNGGYLTHIKTTDGSAVPSQVLSLYTTTDGLVWVGTKNKGVWVAHVSKISHIGHENVPKAGLGNSNVWAVLYDSDDNLWVGTENGISLKRDGESTFEYFVQEANNPRSLSGNVINALLEDRKGNIWVATLGGGINQYQAETNDFVNFSVRRGALSQKNSTVSSLLEDSKGRLWIGTAYSGVAVFEPNTGMWEYFFADGSENSLSSNKISCMVEDFNGNIWIGTNGGGLNKFSINEYSFEQFKYNVTNSNGLSDDFINSLAVDASGNVFAGTQNGGLNMYVRRYGVFKHFGEQHGLPDKQIKSVVVDKDGFLWVTTTFGVSRFEHVNEQFTNYGSAYGINSNGFNSHVAHSDISGKLYFGSRNGLFRFFPSQLTPSTEEQPVIFTGLKMFNQSVEPSVNGVIESEIWFADKVNLSYLDYAISFRFSSLNFWKSNHTKYRYMLAGFDKAWHVVESSEPLATYINLPGGKYELLLSATNEAGVWSTNPVSIKVYVKPPFWETPWFRIVGFLFFTALLNLAYRLRIRRIDDRNERLEHLVNKRTEQLYDTNSELEEKQQELESQSEKLRESNGLLVEQQEELMVGKGRLEEQIQFIDKQNRFITSSLEYGKTIQEAMLPLEDVMNLHFNTFLFFKPKDIVSGDFYWFAEPVDEPYVFAAVVDCTGHGVPGAFMSFIGTQLLNKIVLHEQIHEPNEILGRLNTEVVRALKQEITDNNDGMDVCLVKIYKPKNDQYKIVYAGAKRKLVYFTQNSAEPKLALGTRKSVGGLHFRMSKNIRFQQEEIMLYANDSIYLSTDGFADQGSPKRKRFGSKAFLALLTKIKDLPLNEQHRRLNTQLQYHIKNEPLRDDITIMGIRLGGKDTKV